MFEFDDEIVSTLLRESSEFQALYKIHDELKEKVRSAESGEKPVDDLTLGTMKKQKLLAKDKMAALIEHYRKERV